MQYHLRHPRNPQDTLQGFHLQQRFVVTEILPKGIHVQRWAAVAHYQGIRAVGGERAHRVESGHHLTLAFRPASGT